MKKYLTAIALMGLLASCTQSGRYSISGKFDDFTGDSIYLQDNSMNVLASVFSTDGSFTFTGDSAQVPRLAIVSSFPIKSAENGEPGPICAFILEAGKLNMIHKSDDLYVMQGTRANSGYAQFQEALSEYNENATSETAQHINDIIADGLRDNTDNYFGLFCLENLFDMDDIESARTLLDMFPENVQKSDEWISLDRTVSSICKFAEGNPYEPFSQEDKDGIVINTADITDPAVNRYVLIDFWASWCGPCMSELPYLKAAYEKYSSKGFQIIGVAVSDEYEPWQAAVNDNGMNWIQLKDNDDSVARQYAIRSIPTNFLIDCSTGLIVAKNLRRDNLEATLSPLFAD